MRDESRAVRTGPLSRVMFASTALLMITAPVAAQKVMLHVPADSSTNISWKHLAVGAGVIVALATIDAPIAHAFHGQLSAGTLNTTRQLDRFGEITGAAAVVGGLTIAGLVSHNRTTLRAALRTAASAGAATVATVALKAAVGRQRPSGDPDLDAFDFHHPGSPAFPSGHATLAFALATSLGDAVGKTWVTIGLYTLASATAAARLIRQDHWFTDVLAGAAVGIASAKFASGRIRLFGLRAPRVLVASHGLGVGWMISTR